MRARAAALSLALLAAPTAPLAGQAAGGGVLLQRYTFADAQAAGLSTFTLRTAPWAVSLPLGGRLSVVASGAWAEGEATGAEGARATLSGFTDTEVGVALALGQDRMVLTASASLPTGHSTLTLPEAAVAGVVAAELLPFAVTSWGSGGGMGGDVAVAVQAGAWGLGVVAGYRAGNSFEPLADESFTYRPGDQARVRLALDRDVGTSGTFSIIVGMQRFSEDELGGANLFRSGDRFEALAGYTFALGLKSSAQIYAGAYHRAAGSVLTTEPTLDGATDSPSQQLFTGGVDLRIPVGRRVTFLPTTEARVFRTADGVGQGWLASGGATLEIILAGRRFGRRLVLAPSGAYRRGHIIVQEGSESDLTGWEAGLTLRVEDRR